VLKASIIRKNDVKTKRSDQIAADCFNIWHKSNILLKIQFLKGYEILIKEHMDQIFNSRKTLF